MAKLTDPGRNRMRGDDGLCRPGAVHYAGRGCSCSLFAFLSDNARQMVEDLEQQLTGKSLRAGLSPNHTWFAARGADSGPSDLPANHQ